MDPGLNLPLEQRPVYLSSAQNDESSDPGRYALIAIVPASYAEVAQFRCGTHKRTRGYTQKKAQISAAICKRISTCCAEIEQLEAVDLATPLTLEDYSVAPQGAIYGVGRFSGQYNPQAVTRVAGLYLTGQAIAAPGLMGAMVSAYMTCGSIMGHDLLRGELKKWR
jgi:all-trans-retinol 13,14-reductase